MSEAVVPGRLLRFRRLRAGRSGLLCGRRRRPLLAALPVRMGGRLRRDGRTRGGGVGGGVGRRGQVFRRPVGHRNAGLVRPGCCGSGGSVELGQPNGQARHGTGPEEHSGADHAKPGTASARQYAVSSQHLAEDDSRRLLHGLVKRSGGRDDLGGQQRRLGRSAQVSGVRGGISHSARSSPSSRRLSTGRRRIEQQVRALPALPSPGNGSAHHARHRCVSAYRWCPVECNIVASSFRRCCQWPHP